MDKKEIAKIAEESVAEEAQKSAEKIKKRNIMEADSEEFWNWWRRNPIQRPTHNEPLPPTGAVDVKGGSRSKSKRKKTPKKNNVYVSPWTGI